MATNFDLQVVQDINYMIRLLPATYTVTEATRLGSIRCKSPTGIFHKKDSEDDEHWDYIVQAIEHHFKERFLEIDHDTNYNHVDFTVHLKTK